MMWYPLDGVWHSSVAARGSVFHLAVDDTKEIKSALCNPRRTALNEGMGITEKYAAAHRSPLCQRCLNLNKEKQ